jgi:putative hydrolase of the HAD superfamily
MRAGFEHIETWIFDLDNTLYPASCRLFDQIDRRMTAFLADYLGLPRDEARALQKQYFREHGTTMNGMMLVHDMDPEPYLAFVHAIDHSPVQPSPALAAAIEALDGRKLIFTNGSLQHAEAVLARLGVAALFDDIHDIRDSGYRPKPQPETYHRLIERLAIVPAAACMFEDIARNLEVPHQLGMVTVLVKPDGEHMDAGYIDLGTGDEPHVHYATDDLAGFLRGVSKPKS